MVTPSLRWLLTGNEKTPVRKIAPDAAIFMVCQGFRLVILPPGEYLFTGFYWRVEALVAAIGLLEVELAGCGWRQLASGDSYELPSDATEPGPIRLNVQRFEVVLIFRQGWEPTPASRLINICRDGQGNFAEETTSPHQTPTYIEVLLPPGPDEVLAGDQSGIIILPPGNRVIPLARVYSVNLLWAADTISCKLAGDLFPLGRREGWKIMKAREADQDENNFPKFFVSGEEAAVVLIRLPLSSLTEMKNSLHDDVNTP